MVCPVLVFDLVNKNLFLFQRKNFFISMQLFFRSDLIFQSFIDGPQVRNKPELSGTQSFVTKAIVLLAILNIF